MFLYFTGISGNGLGGTRLNSALYLTGTQTMSANINGSVIAVDYRSYLSDIRLPCTVCLAVGVGYVESEDYALSADIALSHTYNLRFYLYNFHVYMLNERHYTIFPAILQ